MPLSKRLSSIRKGMENLQARIKPLRKELKKLEHAHTILCTKKWKLEEVELKQKKGSLVVKRAPKATPQNITTLFQSLPKEARKELLSKLKINC